MVSPDGLAQSARHLHETYTEHLPAVERLQSEILSEDLISTKGDETFWNRTRLSDFQEDRITDYLGDTLSIFRFLRRARYDAAKAKELILTNLKWRLDTNVDHLDITTAEGDGPLVDLLERGLFHFIWPTQRDATAPSSENYARDTLARPVALLRLSEVTRDGESLEPLRQFILAMLEVGRRYLRDLAHEGNIEDPSAMIQFVLIVDLKNAGIANMEMEIIPYLVDLLKNHYPGACAAIYVLNYGWMYSGMWAIAKRMVPEKALARIFFPSSSEIASFVGPASLPKEYGGENDYNYSWKSDPILKRYGKPSSQSWSGSGVKSPVLSRKSSRPPTRANSFDSIADHYQSAAQNTPWSSRPGTADGGQRRSHIAFGMTPTASIAADLDKVDRWDSEKLEAQQDRPRTRTNGTNNAFSPSALLSALRSRFSGQTVTHTAHYPSNVGDYDAEDDSDLNPPHRQRDAERARSRERLKNSTTRTRSLSPIRSSPSEGERLATNRYVRYRKPPAAQGGTRGLPYPRRRARDLIKMLTHLTILRFLTLHRRLRTALTATVRKVAGPQAHLSTAWLYLSVVLISLFGGRMVVQGLSAVLARRTLTTGQRDTNAERRRTYA